MRAAHKHTRTSHMRPGHHNNEMMMMMMMVGRVSRCLPHSWCFAICIAQFSVFIVFTFSAIIWLCCVAVLFTIKYVNVVCRCIICFDLNTFTVCPFIRVCIIELYCSWQIIIWGVPLLLSLCLYFFSIRYNDINLCLFESFKHPLILHSLYMRTYVCARCIYKYFFSFVILRFG